MQMKVAYLGECCKEHLFISKEEKQVPRFMAGRGRLTLLFYANAVGFMIRTALTERATNPWALKEKYTDQLPGFWLCNKNAWAIRNLFLDWFHWCFVPKMRKCLASKELCFKVLLQLDNVTGYPVPHEFKTKGFKLVHLPPYTMPLIQPLDQRVIRTFMTHGKDCQYYERKPQ